MMILQKEFEIVVYMYIYKAARVRCSTHGINLTKEEKRSCLCVIEHFLFWGEMGPLNRHTWSPNKVGLLVFSILLSETKSEIERAWYIFSHIRVNEVRREL